MLFSINTVFPPGKSGRKISREIQGFKISRFPENLCWNPGNFFYINKISVVLITIISTKNASLLFQFFLLTKNYFSKFANFLRQNAYEIKMFSSICLKN